MTAQELLNRIVKIRKAIDYRNTKIASLVAQAEKTSACLTGMPHIPSSGHSSMEAAVCRKLDLEREIEELDLERKSLIAKIDLLDDGDLSRILTLRYVQEAPWDDIMAEMGFSETHIFRLHRKALAIFDQKLKEGS